VGKFSEGASLQGRRNLETGNWKLDIGEKETLTYHYIELMNVLGFLN
jgi:hypothetical protein